MGAGPVDEVIPQQDAHVYVTGAGEDPLWAGPPVDALDEGRRLAHIAEFAQQARRPLHLPRGNQEIEIDQGPQSAVLALGYAGWAPGQLENEITQNGWLNCDADPELIFGQDVGAKYEKAMRKIGIDLGKLSSEAGHA